MEDDKLRRTLDLNDFWIKIKMKEYEERVKMNKMGEAESQHDEIVAQTFKDLRVDEVDITPEEARKMVLKSDMLIILGMTVQLMFFLFK